MAKHKVFKGKFDGKVGYGVEQGNAVLYEAMFNKKVATRIAEMENDRKNPPKDWFETKERLLAEGFKEKDL